MLRKYNIHRDRNRQERDWERERLWAKIKRFREQKIQHSTNYSSIENWENSDEKSVKEINQENFPEIKKYTFLIKKKGPASIQQK